jgi:hypothetical protein
MKLTRSEFLSSVAAAAVAAAVAPGAAAAGAKQAPADTADGFERFLQSSFWVDRTPGWSQELVLTAVNRRPSAPGSEQFTLVFRAPDGSVPEGTWRVEHRALGELRLFLVPAGETPAGRLFRADFNLLRDAAPKKRPAR